MYVFDANAFSTLGFYYPRRFPSIWKHITKLARNEELISVREVRRELDQRSTESHLDIWVDDHRDIFLLPNDKEAGIVMQLMANPTYRGFVKRQNLLKAMPVADPFLIAAAAVRDWTVVTQEKLKPNAARIPTACEDLGVDWTNVEGFLEREELEF